jgi:hypothetical protein
LLLNLIPYLLCRILWNSFFGLKWPGKEGREEKRNQEKEKEENPNSKDSFFIILPPGRMNSTI